MKVKFFAFIFLCFSQQISWADRNITVLKMNCILENGSWGECSKVKRLALVPETNITKDSKTKTKDQNKTAKLQNKIDKKQKIKAPPNSYSETIITLKNSKEKVNILEITKSDSTNIQSYRSTYIIKNGDTIGAIARKFNIAQSEIVNMNPDIKSKKLKLGREIYMPVDQDVVDSISNEEYKISHGDTIDKISKKLKISASELKKYNKNKLEKKLTTGDTILLPLPTNINKLKKTKEDKVAEDDLIVIETKSKHTLRVTASAYTSHVAQTSATPFIGAWGHRLVPGQKTIAVSRDLISAYGLKNGSKVKIGGLDGEYIVRDKMNARYEKHIDIYMGLDRAKALRWGRRSAILSW